MLIFVLILVALLVLSFITALRSMKDFDMPKEVENILLAKKVRGTIIFLEGKKIKHYSSSSSGSSSD